MRELLARIRDAADIPPERRRMLVADLERVLELAAAAAGARPHGACLRPHMDALHPLLSGLSEKRIANLKASVRACLRWSYATWPGAARRPPMSDAWSRTFGRLPRPSKSAMSVSRLAHWANREGVEPDAIDDAAFARFREHVEATAAAGNLTAVFRETARHWNIAVDTVAGWPPRKLTVPSKHTATRTPKASDLSPELAADMERYFRFMRGGHRPGQATRPGKGRFRAAVARRKARADKTRVYKSSTINQRDQFLRRAVGLAAEERECAVADIQSLDELVAPGMPEAIMERYAEELGNRAGAGGPAAPRMSKAITARQGEEAEDQEDAPPSLRLMATTLNVMARTYLRADDDTLETLEALVAEAGPMQFGMTAKNRERLRSITRAQYQALFRLPAKLIGGAARKVACGEASVSDLVDAQAGAAIAMLIHAPVRGGCLVATRLGDHLILPTIDGEEGRLRYPAGMVKGGRPLDFPIPPDVVKLLRIHTDVVMPAFRRSGFTAALFPGLRNETKGVCHLGSQIAERIGEEIGMRINQHFFRHLLAHIYLVNNPGRYDVVQHLLGHATVETTKRYYTGAEVEACLRDVSRVLAGLKVDFGLDPGDMSRLVPEHGSKVRAGTAARRPRPASTGTPLAARASRDRAGHRLPFPGPLDSSEP